MEPGSLWLRSPPPGCHAHAAGPSSRWGERSKPPGRSACTRPDDKKQLDSGKPTANVFCLLNLRADGTANPSSPFSLAPAPQECSSEWKATGLNRELSSRTPASPPRRLVIPLRWLSHHPLLAALRASPQQPPPPLPTPLTVPEARTQERGGYAHMEDALGWPPEMLHRS